MRSVLYDGWDLAYHPNSFAALHLLTLLEYHPEGSAAIAALPAVPHYDLPPEVDTRIINLPDTDAGRLRWEQRLLPRLAGELKVDLAHVTSGRPALFGRRPCLVSPAGAPVERLPDGEFAARPGLASRLGEALAQGGMARVAGVLWPSDLPAPEGQLPLYVLPPVVHPAFGKASANRAMTQAEGDELAKIGLPDEYILCHSPGGEANLHRVLGVWSWAAGPIGEYHPLIWVGLEEEWRDGVRGLLAAGQLGETLRFLPALSPGALALVYQGCSALLHPTPVYPWGDALRLALASGKPAVGLESALGDALVGPAAYLVRSGESEGETHRSLGAALISVVVEESLAERLSQAARQRAADWDDEAFAPALQALYQRFWR